MARLSLPIAMMKSHYAVVVVGSGYGGAIAACRLARAGKSVCVLERGREIRPGEYPDTKIKALKEMQIDTPEKHIGPPAGLYDFRINNDINVFVGCGLGGTSLVNANVALRVEPRVFSELCWPKPLRDDLDTLLWGYERAEEMLRPEPYPADFPPLTKLIALEQSARALGQPFYRPPLNVSFRTGPNPVGIEQKACVLCGDCVTGCNYSSKNTVLMNYLPDANRHGAEIFTQVSVRWVERTGGRWLVHFEVVDSGQDEFAAPTQFVAADIVVLGAGSLGSTEILLRSRRKGLALSDRLGRDFSGNGDVLAFDYAADVPINGIGFGDMKPGEAEPVGPTITGVIDARNQPVLEKGFVVEEGAIPGAIREAAATLLGIEAAVAPGVPLSDRSTDELAAPLVSFGILDQAPIERTQTYLVMSFDGARGRLYLEDDRLRIDWPGVGHDDDVRQINKTLVKASQPLGGVYLRDPLWTKLFQHGLITVHPLGGCAMGATADIGVVDHKGRVFSGTSGEEVHEGLYVCDGAVIPSPIGVNPLLTISALAERTCFYLAHDRGWKIDYSLLTQPTRSEVDNKSIGIQFSESMKGYFSTREKVDFRKGAIQGEADESSFEFVLTIASQDVEAMLSDSNHEARMYGTVRAPGLSSKPLTVTDGVFRLFVEYPEVPHTRFMRYWMKLNTEEGRVYFFDGYKVIAEGSATDLWEATTTLYITICDGQDAQAPVHGRGILRISPEGFLRQLKTIQATGNANRLAQVEAVLRFGKFFAGSLFNNYFIRPLTDLF